MLSERAELEMKYAKGLKQWSRKWEDAVNKSPEYGTLENSVKALTVEANETAGKNSLISSPNSSSEFDFSSLPRIHSYEVTKI